VSLQKRATGWWKILFSLVMIAMAAEKQAFCEDSPAGLAIDASAPDFALSGVDDKLHKLSDYASSKVLVVAFLCNHCTDSQLYEARVQKIVEEYKAKSVTLVAIQSDNPDSVTESDLAYSDVGESLDDMKARASFRHFSFPYLYDGDTQKVARLYGATVTPEVFVFDQARKLRYKGRIDDNTTESLVKSTDARNAIEAVLAGKTVETVQTVAVGCSLVWKKTPDAISAETNKIATEPVKLSLVGTAEMAKLRNNPTGKFLLVNFFATWCGPCVSEFPDLMVTNRMYRGRQFAMSIVSTNEPGEEPEVIKFLQKMHASTTNLLFGTTDNYGLQAAFDPNMSGAVPFTVLLAPNGDALYQEQGDLDVMAARRAILANLPDDKDHQGSQRYWSGK
jgi:thiol-disulfide isomerase/thioredoxin